MSVDWQKYCASPGDAQRQGKVPEDNAILALIVGDVRAIAGLTVVHTPDSLRGNRAHVDVVGPKTERVRSRLLEISVIVLPLGS